MALMSEVEEEARRNRARAYRLEIRESIIGGMCQVEQLPVNPEGVNRRKEEMPQVVAMIIAPALAFEDADCQSAEYVTLDNARYDLKERLRLLFSRPHPLHNPNPTY